jgi:DNA segregation ATPase FtsK/SpoIIIE-like protein
MSKEIMLELWCELDDTEMLVRGQMLGAVVAEVELAEVQKSDAMKGFTDQLKALSQQRSKLGGIIRRKAETRMVNCDVQFHSPVPGTKRITRLDTGEFVRDEPMTAAEHQGNLFTPDAPKEAAPADANDELLDDAVRIVFEFGKASTSLLQRRLKVGYGRASHLIDLMERNGLVGPANGSKPRDIIQPAEEPATN